MKPAKAPKRYLLLLALLLLPMAAYWLADTWLESSGGRQMLEQELARRLGMTVKLEGDFDLMLLPAIGVSGTELVIGGEAETESGTQDSPPGFFAHSREFEVSVALKPLFRRQLIVEWIRLSSGTVYPDRYSHAGNGGEAAITDPAKSGEGKRDSTVVLPEIQELTLREFDFVLDEESGSVVHLKELQIRDFADRIKAPFRLEIEDLLTAAGWLRWDTLLSKIDFGDLNLAVGNQAMNGEACLLLQEPLVLNVDVRTESLDADAIKDLQLDTGSGGGDSQLEIRARLSADELRTNGVVARGVVLNLGQDPSCH